MTRQPIAAILVLGALFMLGAQCGGPRLPRPDERVPSTADGSCDGLLDYGDEFVVASVQTRWMGPVGFDVWEVELDVELTNLGNGQLQSATAVPDFSAVPDLQIVGSATLPADYGPIDPHGNVWSTAPLRVQLPATHFGELVSALLDGAVPLSVYGDEANVLAPGVQILDWSATEDRMYYLASQPSGGFGHVPNPDPGAGPFDPGAEFVVSFLEFLDDVGTVFDQLDGSDRSYLVEDPAAPLVNIPDVFDKVRVVSAERMDGEDDNYTLWVATLKRTDTELLPEIYSTASFCTGESRQIDLPVHASRLLDLDGDPVAPEESDRHPHPIRFNDIPFAGGLVTLSGQVQGHVLEPSLALRIRDGQISTQAGFDTDLALTAQLEASAAGPVLDEQLELWSLCFPLPDFVAGPVSVPINLQLVHRIGLDASVEAGMVIDFQKHFDSGFSIRCESGGGAPASCSSEGHRAETPIQLTPPRLTDDTAAHARVETTIESSLNFLAPYPFCDTGPGIFLDATAYGTLDVEPTQDPWWNLGYGLDVNAGIELEILGLDIARYDAPLFSAPPDPGLDSGIGGARSSGEDQRWAVAIDDTAVPNGVGSAKIAALPDGSSVAIASEAIGSRTPLVKLDRWGAMLWVKEFAAGKVPTRVRALPDGSFVVVGTNAWLARVDADGNLLWSFDAEISRQSFASARCVLYDVAPLETSPGHWDFVAVGRMGNNIVTNYDACALRVNEDGTLAWARLYTAERVQTFFGVTPMSDGNVMVVGTDFWSFAGNRGIPLFVKLDPESGDVLFWKGLPMTRLAELNAVTEAADGTLFAAGATSGIIYTTGTAIIARIAPDGSDARHAEVYQDEDWEALLDFEAWVDTEGGDTPYDAWWDIVPSGDGFVVAGHTGLGQDTAARAAKVNANLGTEWVTTFDGADTDWLTGIAPSADGLLVAGFSASLPEPDGPNTGEEQLLVMKLPFTGALDFLPEVAMTTRWVAPGVRDSTLDPAVNPTPDPTIDNPYAVEDAVVVSSGPNAGLLVNASPYCVELLTETGHVTTTDACAD